MNTYELTIGLKDVNNKHYIECEDSEIEKKLSDISNFGFCKKDGPTRLYIPAHRILFIECVAIERSQDIKDEVDKTIKKLLTE